MKNLKRAHKNLIAIDKKEDPETGRKIEEIAELFNKKSEQLEAMRRGWWEHHFDIDWRFQIPILLMIELLETILFWYAGLFYDWWLGDMLLNKNWYYGLEDVEYNIWIMRKGAPVKGNIKKKVERPGLTDDEIEELR